MSEIIIVKSDGKEEEMYIMYVAYRVMNKEGARRVQKKAYPEVEQGERRWSARRSYQSRAIAGQIERTKIFVI